MWQDTLCSLKPRPPLAVPDVLRVLETSQTVPLRVSAVSTKISNPASTHKKHPRRAKRHIVGVGWGGRIRTYECSSQSAVSYRLTTPQYSVFCGF